MIYFTSDLHLGHANIIRLCHRPCADVDEMNAALIANWNARIMGGDTEVDAVRRATSSLLSDRMRSSKN